MKTTINGHRAVPARYYRTDGQLEVLDGYYATEGGEIYARMEPAIWSQTQAVIDLIGADNWEMLKYKYLHESTSTSEMREYHTRKLSEIIRLDNYYYALTGLIHEPYYRRMKPTSINKGFMGVKITTNGIRGCLMIGRIVYSSFNDMTKKQCCMGVSVIDGNKINTSLSNLKLNSNQRWKNKTCTRRKLDESWKDYL